MRRGHFSVLFAIFFFLCLAATALRQFRYEQGVREKGRIDASVLFAADAAAEALLGAGENLPSMLGNVSERFFSSLGVAMGEDGDMLLVYVPLLVVTCDDGMYLNVLSLDGGMLVRQWTECLPYLYEDDAFFYRLSLDGGITSRKKDTGEIVRTTYEEVMADGYLMAYYHPSKLFESEDAYRKALWASVAGSVEREAEIALSEESYLVGEMGYSISYTAPSFLNVFPEKYSRSFAAVYQGFPDVYGIGFSYGGVTASSYTVAKGEYYVTAAQGAGSYYGVAHHEGCVYMAGWEIGPVGRDDAIGVYGAYGCPYCIGKNEGFTFAP